MVRARNKVNSVWEEAVLT